MGERNQRSSSIDYVFRYTNTNYIHIKTFVHTKECGYGPIMWTFLTMFLLARMLGCSPLVMATSFDPQWWTSSEAISSREYLIEQTLGAILPHTCHKNISGAIFLMIFQFIETRSKFIGLISSIALYHLLLQNHN